MLVRALNFAASYDRLTHYAFRYPAKFHPPVAHYLIENFSEESQHVIDPFCGSGTLLVEGIKTGRKMYGVDLDPVACFVSRIKSTPVKGTEVFEQLDRFANRTIERKGLRGGSSWVPDIPNMEHWFEKHVLRDMASLYESIIRTRSLSPTARAIAKCAFLGCIRNWSNADPVPVSGLEVTRHIKLKRADGFFPNVRGQYATALRRLSSSIQQFTSSVDGRAPTPVVNQSDAYEFFRKTHRCFDALITSPPYLTAVDYYRRHTLEMYWLLPESSLLLRLYLS
jgi:adenine-specific DNA methylase